MPSRARGVLGRAGSRDERDRRGGGRRGRGREAAAPDRLDPTAAAGSERRRAVHVLLGAHRLERGQVDVLVELGHLRLGGGLPTLATATRPIAGEM